MNNETIEIDGYTVVIGQEEGASNPFEDWDCGPPLLTYYERIKEYGDVPDIGDLVAMIPDEYFARGKRVEFIKRNLNVSLREFAEGRANYGDTVRDYFAEELSKQCPMPSGRSWSEATARFECLEWLCGLAGIPCHYAQSNGYCQGDSALVMAFATPKWVELVGAPQESLVGQCKNACDLYGYWAWGDVYGVSEITAPDGEEVKDCSCWGFYGPHEESGLMDHAKSMIEWHKDWVKKEEAEANEMACRDIATE